jgi:membrane-bound metal-dependent hydrolase YbcI (DUF457 family)
MASILGHGLAGVIIKQSFKTTLSPAKEKLLLALVLFLSLLPDFDVIFFILLKPVGMTPHRGLTHSLLFIGFAALIFMGLTFKAFPLGKTKLFLLYIIVLFTHLLLDFLMGAGPPIRFFAPFWQRGFLSPVKLIPCAYYSTSAGGLLRLLRHLPTQVGFAIEILLFVPVIVILKIKGNDRRTAIIRKVCVAVATMAVLMTIILYNFLIPAFR